MSGWGLMYCPDGCAITPLPPCQQINGLVLSKGFVCCFFSFFNSFPWILCVLCFFPFQRVPIPPMDVTQDPPPVILRGAKTEEETAKTLCNQQQFHWRWKVASRNCQLPLIFSAKWEESSCSSVQHSGRMQRPLHPYSGGRKCKRKRRLCIYDSPNNLLWLYFVFNLLPVREFLFFFFTVQTDGVFVKQNRRNQRGEEKKNKKLTLIKKRDGA